jgi:methylated-DNA-protein-cysteine methyltransferase-like protein
MWVRLTFVEQPSEYVEQVLDVVDAIPSGRVMSYGMIAELVRERTGRGSARTVGAVMAGYGGAVAWHRVVTADGRLPPGHEIEAGKRLRAEGVPFRGEKVEIRAAAWWPGDDAPSSTVEGR